MRSTGMAYEMDAAAVARLDAYFAQIGANLRDKRKRESFAMYALGLLGSSERKSVEPMAALACGDEAKSCATQHKSMTQASSRKETTRSGFNASLQDRPARSRIARSASV